MAQLFAPRANVVVRSVLVAAGGLAVCASFAVWAFARSPAATGQYRRPEQPIPFSHPLHVNALQIDCRYCHTGAERSTMAGMPPTKACVPCHRDDLLQTSLFAPLRQSLSSGRGIAWRRVTSLADFVFFDHAVHVRTGVACESCHGPVQLMHELYQAAPLTMESCLGCHRAAAAGYDRGRLTSCTTCHR